MNNSERASYIRGLLEGMELDPSAKETKLFNAIVELLDDLSASVEELEDGYDELSQQVDEIDHDLGDLEEDYYCDDEDEDSCSCGHHHGGCHHGSHEGCGCGHHHDGDLNFEVICPSCGDTIQLDDEMLEEERMTCPNCGEVLEFDFDDDDDFEDLDSNQEPGDGEEDK